MDEGIGSEEREHKNAEVHNLSISDVQFPLPGAGWQAEGPFHKTEAESDPGAEWQGRRWGLAVMRLQT